MLICLGGKLLTNAKLRTLGQTFASSLYGSNVSSTNVPEKNSELTSRMVEFLTGGKSETDEEKGAIQTELTSIIERTVSESLGAYEWDPKNLSIESAIEDLVERRKTEMTEMDMSSCEDEVGE